MDDEYWVRLCLKKKNWVSFYLSWYWYIFKVRMVFMILRLNIVSVVIL